VISSQSNGGKTGLFGLTAGFGLSITPTLPNPATLITCFSASFLS
jgi:hypothetical protein